MYYDGIDINYCQEYVCLDGLKLEGCSEVKKYGPNICFKQKNNIKIVQYLHYMQVCKCKRRINVLEVDGRLN